jgi:hypothetical protein
MLKRCILSAKLEGAFERSPQVVKAPFRMSMETGRSNLRSFTGSGEDVCVVDLSAEA